MPQPGGAPAPIGPSPRVIGLLLVPQFSMIAFTAAIEPLRLANRAAGSTLYEWRLYSADGAPVEASNGIAIGVSGRFSALRDLSAAIVCAGVDVQDARPPRTDGGLRRLSSFGTVVGAVCTGTYVLARAGPPRRAPGNDPLGELLEPARPSFPELEISRELFEVDRNRITCAGRHGGDRHDDLAHRRAITAPTSPRQVTDQLIHHRVREADEHQRMDLRARLDVAHPKVLAAVAQMERSIERPLSCAALAAKAGCSTRQLERLFCKYLGHSPTRHYLSVRLERARDLLRQTSLPMIAVATACGFASASHFSKSYVEHFGRTPSAERKRPTGGAAAADGRAWLDTGRGPADRVRCRPKPSSRSSSARSCMRAGTRRSSPAPDKFLDTVLVATGAGAIAAALICPSSPCPPPRACPISASRPCCRSIYFVLVAAAYRGGRHELRLSAHARHGAADRRGGRAASLLGEVSTPGAWIGVALICGSVLALTLAQPARRRQLHADRLRARQRRGDRRLHPRRRRRARGSPGRSPPTRCGSRCSPRRPSSPGRHGGTRGRSCATSGRAGGSGSAAGLRRSAPTASRSGR